MEKIKAGVIGVGYLGRFHAQKYAALENAELVGVVDIDPDKAARVAQECQTQAYTDFRELLPRVQAVSVAVPTTLHFAVVQECLNHHIDVLAEKPLATSVAEAEALVSLAREKEKILQVGHLERFQPGHGGTDPPGARPPLYRNPSAGFFLRNGALMWTSSVI